LIYHAVADEPSVALGIVPVIAEPAIAFEGSSRQAVGVALELVWVQPKRQV